MDFLPDVVGDVKAKRELSGLDDVVVERLVKKRLPQEKKLRGKLSKAKSFADVKRGTLYKEFRRQLRGELRTLFGAFNLDEKGRRDKLLDAYEQGDEEERARIVKELLSLHQSAKERVPYYTRVYEKILAITGEPRSILDVGCGANPYAYEYLGCTPYYVAIDLPCDDLKRIKRFFDAAKIDGDVFGLDVVGEPSRSSELFRDQHFDVVFAFKVFDTFEFAKKNSTGKVLDALNASWIIASFATRSLGGKKVIRAEKRAWFEKLLARREWQYTVFEVGGEAYYVIETRNESNN